MQCFLNLLKNAAEATKIGDELVLRTCYSMTRYISSLSDGKRMHLPLQIEIEDTGKGIPEELSEHIFEPFISTKSGGSGLGWQWWPVLSLTMVEQLPISAGAKGRASVLICLF